MEFRKSGHKFADTFALVPTAHTYDLPIPKPALFGKQSLALVVAPSGAVTSIDYGKVSGAGDASGSLAAILAAPSATAVDMVAVAKDQADLIVQQQRLVQCKAKPKTCQ